jgi:hypothetical protein
MSALIAVALFQTANAHATDDATCQTSYVNGQRLYKLSHDLIGGRSELLVCAKTCPDELRESCGKWLREIDTELPSVVVKAKDANDHDVSDIAMIVDGKALTNYVEGTPIELNPGAHTIRVVRGTRPPVEQRVVLTSGEKLRVIELWTEPRAVDQFTSRTRRPVPSTSLVLFGVGAVGLASFGVFSIWTSAEYGKTSACDPNCAPANRDSSFATKTIIGDISLGVGAAALVGGAIFYLARPTVTDRVPKPATAWVAPTLGGVSFGGTF